MHRSSNHNCAENIYFTIYVFRLIIWSRCYRVCGILFIYFSHLVHVVVIIRPSRKWTFACIKHAIPQRRKHQYQALKATSFIIITYNKLQFILQFVTCSCCQALPLLLSANHH